jgi:hypothetical protein
MRFLGIGLRGVMLCMLLLFALLVSGNVTLAQTTYTTDDNLAHFTSGIGSYATLDHFASSDGCTTAPFTPSSAELGGGNACRVYNGTLTGNGLSDGNNWILASFPSAVSTIVVFPSIDHYGSAYDGYQYTIYGSNDGVNWTFLFDAAQVSTAGEPFTLVESSGTPPSTVNNILSGGAGPGGQIGYIAKFTFDTAYQFYAFGASTVAFAQGNADQELDAVGTPGQTIVGTPATPGQPQTFTFNGNEGTLDIYTAIIPNIDDNLGNSGSIPIITTNAVAPTSPNQLWANSPLATATCIPLVSAGGNCAPKLEVCASSSTDTSPTGAKCPFDSTGAQDVLNSELFDPVTPITPLNLVGNPGVVALNDTQACPFAQQGNLPIPACPTNGSKFFDGPGEHKIVHGTSNSYYYYVQGILAAKTDTSGFGNYNGWVRGNATGGVHVPLKAMPPATPNPNPTGFYPSPIDYSAYIVLPSAAAAPDPTLPPFTFPPSTATTGTVVFSNNTTVGSTVISSGISTNGSTCGNVTNPATGRVTPADSAYAFPVDAALGQLAEGTYNLFYETEDCNRTAERQFSYGLGVDPNFPGVNAWLTSYKSLTFMVDNTPPTTSISNPVAGTIYAANSAVPASFLCNDGVGSGVLPIGFCTGKNANGTVVPLNGNVDTAPTGGILTPKTFTITSSDNVGNLSAPRSVSYNVSCLYAKNTFSPSTLVRGKNFTLTASATDCTSSWQALTINVVLTGPMGLSCASKSQTLVNKLTLPIPPGTSPSFTFGPFSVPKTACVGNYTFTTTTSNKGTVVFIYTQQFNVTQ